MRYTLVNKHVGKLSGAEYHSVEGSNLCGVGGSIKRGGERDLMIYSVGPDCALLQRGQYCPTSLGS